MWRRVLMGIIGVASLAGGLGSVVYLLLFAETIYFMWLMGAAMFIVIGLVGLRDLFRG